MLRAQQEFEQPLNDARSEARNALVKYEKAPTLEKQGRGHAVHQFTAKDEAKVQVGDHYTINNYTNKPSNEVSKEQIMGWMKCTDFTTVYKQRHLPTLFPNIGEEQLKSDEFKQWYDGTIKWLWCYGMPGVGKSALATIIIRHIVKLRKELAAEKRIGLAYVYCDYATKDQSALDYVGALLRQLVNLSEQVSPEVVALYNDHKQDCSPLCLLLEGYEQTLETEVRRFDSVYIIVDALDECRDDDEDESNSCTKEGLLKALGKLREKVHVLFTSRDEDPAASLAGFTIPVSTMEVSTTDDDIRAYVQARIKNSRLLQCCTGRELRKKMESIIAKRAAGMFLPAKLHFEILASTVDVCQPKKRNVDALKNALKTLPQFGYAQAWDTYQEAYKKILKNIWSQGESKANLARQVLSWVVFTQEPSNLTLPVLQRALSLQDAGDTIQQDLEPLKPWDYTFDTESKDDSQTYSISTSGDDLSDTSTSSRGDVIPKETLLSVCRGLITMDRESTLVRLVHYTARDYFANESVRADSFPHAQSQLTRSCMTSLMSADGDHSFDQYSHRHWGHHAQTAEKEFQTEILDLVQDQKRITSSFQFVVDSLTPAWAESRNPAMPCFPPLHVAAYFGLKLTATHLMEGLEPEDIKAEDSGGWTAMKWAVIGGSETLVRLLFQRESDFLSSDIAFFAVGTRSYLVEQVPFWCKGSTRFHVGDILSLKNGLSFTKVLPRAIRPNASDEVIRFLLKNTPNENIDSKRPKDGRTLLSVVAENWQWDYVGILLERGADVDLKDNQGRTPLLWALNCPRKKVQIGTIVTFEEDFMVTGDLVIAEDDMMIMLRLQSLGDILDLDSSTGISIADHQISEKTVEPFICKLIGNNLEATDEEGRTALSLACESRFHAVTKELVRRGADLSTRDTLGMTPLHYACCLPCFQIVTIGSLSCLHKSKVRLGTGRFPRLCPRKHENISGSIGRSVELLLKSGAEADARNCLGETPLSLAEADGLESYVRLLNPLRQSSFGQTGPAPDCIEGGDYTKLLLAMWYGGSRFQVKHLSLTGESTLTTHSLSSIELLHIKDRGSAVFSGKSIIKRAMVFSDESRIEIRETSAIERLLVQVGTQAIIRGSPGKCGECGSRNRRLLIKTESTMEGLIVSELCEDNCKGSSTMYLDF